MPPNPIVEVAELVVGVVPTNPIVELPTNPIVELRSLLMKSVVNGSDG